MNSTAPKLASLSERRFPENLPPGWATLLAPEKDKDYFRNLTAFIKAELVKGKKIFPPTSKTLRALQMTDYSDVKILLLGQDPYHGDKQAVGLCFAVPSELKPKPPSLLNIFKEIESDIGFRWNGQDSELTGWASQGVLLLNTVLSVEKNQAFSHRNQGWEIFTDQVIRHLNDREEPVIFILWGSAAQKKSELIDSKKHFILKSAHPSPLSAHRGFLGCRHFSKANQKLLEWGREPIDWTRIDESE